MTQKKKLWVRLLITAAGMITGIALLLALSWLHKAWHTAWLAAQQPDVQGSSLLSVEAVSIIMMILTVVLILVCGWFTTFGMATGTVLFVGLLVNHLLWGGENYLVQGDRYETQIGPVLGLLYEWNGSSPYVAMGAALCLGAGFIGWVRRRDSKSLNGQKWWHRLLIILAGVLIGLVFLVVMAWLHGLWLSEIYVDRSAWSFGVFAVLLLIVLIAGYFPLIGLSAGLSFAGGIIALVIKHGGIASAPIGGIDPAGSAFLYLLSPQYVTISNGVSVFTLVAATACLVSTVIRFVRPSAQTNKDSWSLITGEHPIRVSK